MKHRCRFFLCLVLSQASLAVCLPARAQIKEPINGRVEMIESGAEPVLPEQLAAGIIGGSLPTAFLGKWYGKVTIKQMDTYPAQHAAEPYCLAFVKEIGKYFAQGQSGQVAFEILPGAGRNVVKASDVWFAHGVRVQLTTGRGPALVPGGYNLPTTVKDEVRQFSEDRAEEIRVDQVRIVDKGERHLLHTGWTEVTVLYQLLKSKRMKVKILDIDYDGQGKPLWKVLIEGDVRR